MDKDTDMLKAAEQEALAAFETATSAHLTAYALRAIAVAQIEIAKEMRKTNALLSSLNEILTNQEVAK